MRHRVRSAVAFVFLAACSGEIAEETSKEAPRTPPESPSTPAPTGMTGSPGEAPGALFVGTSLRRLTRFEYENTVRDLFGAGVTAPRLPEEERPHGFDNDAAVQTVAPALAEQLLSNADAIAERVVANPKAVSACLGTPPASIEARDNCARAALTSLGQRAWRRPLTSDETARLFSLFTKASGPTDYAGLRLVITRLLIAAPFLFRIETGVASPGGRRPSSWEMASRLSYLVWGSLPDQPLFQAAERDALVTREQITAQLTRMLADRRARTALAHFTRQWLPLDELARVERDPKIFVGFEAAAVPRMEQETVGFVENALFGGGGFAALLTGRTAMQDARHSGVLTQPAVMTALAHPDQTSITRRGMFVREQLLCQDVPDPPPGVDNNVDPPTASTSGRERIGERLQSSFCAACHQRMDLIGFAFERFDAVGRWREGEGGKPIDSRGELIDADVAGTFDGAAALGQRLAGSATVRACFARQWIRFAFGRAETPADEPLVHEMAQVLARPEAGLADLLASLVTSPSFTRLGGDR